MDFKLCILEFSGQSRAFEVKNDFSRPQNVAKQQDTYVFGISNVRHDQNHKK